MKTEKQIKELAKKYKMPLEIMKTILLDFALEKAHSGRLQFKSVLD